MSIVKEQIQHITDSKKDDMEKLFSKSENLILQQVSKADINKITSANSMVKKVSKQVKRAIDYKIVAKTEDILSEIELLKMSIQSYAPLWSIYEALVAESFEERNTPLSTKNDKQEHIPNKCYFISKKLIDYLNKSDNMHKHPFRNLTKGKDPIPTFFKDNGDKFMVSLKIKLDKLFYNKLKEIKHISLSDDPKAEEAKAMISKFSFSEEDIDEESYSVESFPNILEVFGPLPDHKDVSKTIKQARRVKYAKLYGYEEMVQAQSSE